MKAWIGLGLVAVALSAPAFAQGHDNGRHEGRDEQRAQGRPGRGPQAPPPGHMRERGREWERHDEYSYGARGPEWRRGARIPPTYRGRQYVVNDWQAHHLRRPPRGHQWVQVGSDYVLVAVASGVIADLLIHH